MNELLTSRRSILRGFAGLIAAPAIIKATSLMPISVPKLVAIPRDAYFYFGRTEPAAGDLRWWMDRNIIQVFDGTSWINRNEAESA